MPHWVLGYDPRHMTCPCVFRFQQEKQWDIKGEKSTVHVMGIDESRPFER